jgi:ribulose-phosphate 3-epimerase
MTKQIRIAPSILSANFACLGEDIAKVEPCAELLHLDVMDGHYVPNITFGPPLVKCVRKITKMFLDVHLMIDNPEKYIEPFAKAGADNLTFHIEATRDPIGLIRRIRELGVQVGVSLDPGTPAEALEPVIDLVDMVLVMTVQPGFGGQAFREDMLPKIEALLKRRPEVIMEVDGGIAEDTLPKVVRAGADTFVAGSAIFGKPDPGKEVMRFKEIIRTVQQNG